MKKKIKKFQTKQKQKLKIPEFWSRCEPISVKKNDTLGCEKKISKNFKKKKKNLF